MPQTPWRHRVRTTGAASPGARVIWNDGAADGDWSNASNWDTGAPGQSDRVYITSTTRIIDTGLGQSSITLEDLYIGAEFVGSLDGLQINANRLVIERRTGAVSIDGTVTEAWIVNSGAEGPAITLDGTFGTLIVSASRGEVQLTAGIVVTDLIVLSSRPFQSWVTIGAGSTITTARVVGPGSRLESASSIGTLIAVDGARVKLTGAAGVTTDLKLGGSARLEHEGSGTIAGGEVYQNGLLDLVDNTNSSVQVDSLIWNGGRGDFRNGAGNLVIGSGWTYRKGNLFFDPGVTVDLA